MRSIAARYIGKQVCSKILLVMMVFATLEFILGVVVDLPKIGRGHYTLLDSMHVLLLALPMRLYGLFSIIAFLGVVLALGAMVKRNELLVFRTAGLSLRTLIRIVLQTVVLLTILVTVIGETVGPIWSEQSINLKEKTASAKQSRLRDYWWKSNGHFNYIQLEQKSHTAQGMVALTLPLSGQEASIAYTPTLKKAGQYWVGSNEVVTELGKQSATVHNHRQVLMQPHFSFAAAQADRHVVGQESWYHLGEMIKQRKQEGRSVSRFEVAYWNRLLQPIATLVLVLFAIPVVFSGHSRASNGSRLLLGVGVGFLFYVMHRLLPPMGILLHWPALVTVVAPLLFFLLLGIFLAKTVRT